MFQITTDANLAETVQFLSVRLKELEAISQQQAKEIDSQARESQKEIDRLKWRTDQLEQEISELKQTRRDETSLLENIHMPEPDTRSQFTAFACTFFCSIQIEGLRDFFSEWESETYEANFIAWV